ncbi:hypothetical protein V8E53_001650 [Lactarius tabidus]
MTPRPTTLTVPRQYAHHVLFTLPAPVPHGVLDTLGRRYISHSFADGTQSAARRYTHGRDSQGSIVVSTRRLLRESMERDLGRVICSSIPESTRMARPVDEGYMRPSCRTRAPITRGGPIATCAASSVLPPMPSVAPVAGLIGPLGSSSFSLPTVERAQRGWRAGVRAHRRRLFSGARRARRSTGVLQNLYSKSLLNPKDRAAGGPSYLGGGP